MQSEHILLFLIVCMLCRFFSKLSRKGRGDEKLEKYTFTVTWKVFVIHDLLPGKFNICRPLNYERGNLGFKNNVMNVVTLL